MTKVTERLADLASGVFLSSAQVTDVQRLTERFVQIDLQAESFRTTSWTPGAKLQIRPRRGTMSLRTYTPVRWDTEQGGTRLVAHTHGDGPGRDWFRAVQVGDVCEFIGPRGSIDLRELSGPVLFVGDESSIGLAAALREVGRDVRYVFEAADPAELTGALDRLGLAEGAVVLERSEDRAALIHEAAGTPGPFDLVVTGDAATVHAVRRASREWTAGPGTTKGPRRTLGKAYWAKGRTGLD